MTPDDLTPDDLDEARYGAGGSVWVRFMIDIFKDDDGWHRPHVYIRSSQPRGYSPAELAVTAPPFRWMGGTS